MQYSIDHHVWTTQISTQSSLSNLSMLLNNEPHCDKLRKLIIHHKLVVCLLCGMNFSVVILFNVFGKNVIFFQQCYTISLSLSFSALPTILSASSILLKFCLMTNFYSFGSLIEWSEFEISIEGCEF